MKPTFEQMPEMLVNLTTQVENLTKSLSDKTEREEILTRKQVAVMFNCNVDTISKWAEKGELDAHCKGNTIYFLRSEILQSVKASKLKVA